MLFEVKNRWTTDVQFAAAIDCGTDAPFSLQLGLAVKWAVKNGANLDGANLVGANLVGADLAHANLAGADLAHADLAHANLAHADLAHANLAHANLAGADLAHADLAYANLVGANLVGADLAHADLAHADLAHANRGFVRCLAIACRLSDNCEFQLWGSVWGGHAVKAGCQMMTIDQFRAHVANEHADAPKASETLRILDYFEATAAAESPHKGG